MHKYVVGLLLSIVTWCCFASNTSDWKYFKTTLIIEGEGKWITEEGRASVSIVNNKIAIHIFLPITGPGGVSTTSNEWESESLIGTISSDGAVKVTETLNGTDADPVKLDGHLYRNISKEQWGDKNMVVTYERIIFVDHGYTVIGLAHRTATQSN
jgi:hypothetical protein